MLKYAFIVLMLMAIKAGWWILPMAGCIWYLWTHSPKPKETTETQEEATDNVP